MDYIVFKKIDDDDILYWSMIKESNVLMVNHTAKIIVTNLNDLDSFRFNDIILKPQSFEKASLICMIETKKKKKDG